MKFSLCIYILTTYSYILDSERSECTYRFYIDVFSSVQGWLG